MWPPVCPLLVWLKALARLYPFCTKPQVAFSLVAVPVPLHAAEMAICICNGCLYLAEGWEGPQAASSNLFILRLDYAKGFGGKYGVQKDRMDKVSCFQEHKNVLLTSVRFSSPCSGYFSRLTAEFCAFLNL